jgi:hypothetical protein
MVFPPGKEWVAKQRVTIFMTNSILVNKQLGIYATQVAQKQQTGMSTPTPRHRTDRRCAANSAPDAGIRGSAVTVRFFVRVRQTE